MRLAPSLVSITRPQFEREPSRIRVMMHGSRCEQCGNRRAFRIHTAITQDQDRCSFATTALAAAARCLEPPRQTCVVVTRVEQHR